MKLFKVALSSSTEGFLELKQVGTYFEISALFPHDKVISQCDIIYHTAYSPPSDEGVACFSIDEIVEQRPSKGTFKLTPPTWYKMKVSRVFVPPKEMV